MYVESYIEQVQQYKECGFSTLEAVSEVDDDAQEAYEQCNCEMI